MQEWLELRGSSRFCGQHRLPALWMGPVPLVLPAGCRDESRQHPIPAHPLHPCAAGVLVFKAAVPGAKEPGPLPSGPRPLPQPRVPLSGPQTCLLLQASTPPCTAPPTRPGDPGSPPIASWPHLLRTPYLRVQPTAPRPRASLPPPQSPTGHGPTRTGRVGLAQPPSSHRELTAVSRLLTPMVSTPGGQVG